MSLLWCGGEDIDFPNGGTSSLSVTTSGFRSSYARCGLFAGGAGGVYSNPFAGGGIASGWLSFQLQWDNNGNEPLFAGLCSSASANLSGLYLGVNNAGNLTLELFNGTTRSVLATSILAPFPQNAQFMVKIDMNLVNYGSTSQVIVYINGSQALSYTGSTAISGVTTLDAVGIKLNTGNGTPAVSELMVADEPTISWQGLVTFAPNGNGPTQQWSDPAYTNIDAVTIDDTSPAYVNTTGQDEQVTINGLPAGSFQIKAVKIAARALSTTGAGSSHLQLGFNNTNNSTVAVEAAHTLTAAYATYEDLLQTDPTNGSAPWGTSLSGYDLDLRSA